MARFLRQTRFQSWSWLSNICFLQVIQFLKMVFQWINVLLNLCRDIMKAYPDAKVLLSVRDPKKWYQSVKNTIYQNSIFDSFPMNVFVKLVGLSGTTSMIRRLCYMPTNGLNIGKSTDSSLQPFLQMKSELFLFQDCLKQLMMVKMFL